MKHIFINLKRFDIPRDKGGVNNLAPAKNWAKFIVDTLSDGLKKFKDEIDCVVFFPEAHILPAIDALQGRKMLRIGCQSVHQYDTAAAGNFGAFTTCLTANAAAALGCGDVIIGHCEERAVKRGIMNDAHADCSRAVNIELNREIICAQNAGLRVLYCIGERAEETGRWQEVLYEQLSEGLEGTDRSKVLIAYEPVWSIGPGKTPAGADYISKIAAFVKEFDACLQVVYGGGLKADNAEEIASIDGIAGGLVALTRFKGDIGFYPHEFFEIVARYLGTSVENDCVISD